MKVPRFTIGRLMLIVGVIALNFAFGRFVRSSQTIGLRYGLLAFGLMPLFNTLLLGLVVRLWNYRIRIIRRKRRSSSTFFSWLGLLSVPMIMASFMIFSFEDFVYDSYLIPIAENLERLLLSSKFFEPPIDYEQPLFEFFISPLFIWVLVSGPQLLTLLLLSWVMSRLEIKIEWRSATVNTSETTRSESLE